MSFLGKIPWQMVMRMVPTVVDVVRGSAAPGPDIDELKDRVRRLEASLADLQKALNALIIGVIVAGLAAVAALAVAIVALAR